ncbi:hypothetical protein BGZ72_003536 [Mortierella alpina]|nr:hypothetical protein BGZ72_003536 [Mortierella alpina]
MGSTIQKYRQRLAEEWPRLVVALVSVYGIYYAANSILSTSQQIKIFGSFGNYHGSRPSSLASSSSSPFVHTPQQITFTPSGRSDDTDVSNNIRNSDHHAKNNVILNQLRLFTGSSQELSNIDFEGRTEAAVVYTLLVISSLSILDNAIGLMVATRRSLRLTQVAFAIWCLRFLFRVLSLVSVMFMLVAGRDTGNNPGPPILSTTAPSDTSGDTHTDASQTMSDDGPRTMMTLTVLEVIVALVHGWSLLVLIRDLRNQPRPRTVIARLWDWFCGSRWGQKLGLHSNPLGSLNNSSVHSFQSNLYVGYSGRGGGAMDVETCSIRSGGSGSSIWDRDIAASLGFGTGLLSSTSSVRSMTVTIPEMLVAAGRSRTSSISSFDSAEKL